MDSEGEDTIYNAEVIMQGVRNVGSAVDFERIADEDDGVDRVSVNPNPVLEADLAYIMRNAFVIDPEKHQGSDDNESASDSDDDVRITLVKDKKSTAKQEEVLVVSSSSSTSSSDDDDVQLRVKKGNEETPCISIESPNSQMQKSNGTGFAKKDAIDNARDVESIVKILLKSLVRKTVRNLKKDGYDAKTDSDNCLSSESDNPGHATTFCSFVENENQILDQIPRVLNEVLPQEEVVFDVEEVNLTNEDHLNQIGTISAVVEKMVVVKSNNDAPALDCETAFFFEDRLYLGKVCDTFGPVKVPYYTMSLSAKVDTSKLTIGTKIYYVPFNQQITKYVFVAQLKKLRGSDASWRNDYEPPENCLDYSDDEKERVAKKSRSKKSVIPNSNTDEQGENFPQSGNRSKRFHSKKQNIQGLTDKSQNKSSYNSVNMLSPAVALPNLPQHFGNQNELASNSLNIHQKIPMHLPLPDPRTSPAQPHNVPITHPSPSPRPGLQPPIRPDLQSLSQPHLQQPIRPILLPPPPRPLVSQNTQFNNGILGSGPEVQPNNIPPNHQVFTPQNKIFFNSHPTSARLPSQAGPNFLNNEPNNSLPVNQMIPPPNLCNPSTALNQPPNLPMNYFGNYSNNLNTAFNQNTSHVYNMNNVHSNSNSGRFPINNHPTYPPRPNVSAHQDRTASNRNDTGIVKLNGFTFKI